jgi:hypothetical protein
MNTNFQMIKELNKKYDAMSHTRGFATKEEVELISKTLCLEEMDILQLRNLRDFVVIFLDQMDMERISKMDKISAITSVIDNYIWKKGGEV